MFDDIKEFTAAKSPNKEGIINALNDHMEQSVVPLTPAFKMKEDDNDWFLILVKYKKEITCQVN
tara:strand:+ start:218 stop:409 length:192 start_codon:yes stop_codon:yes gene_type:complete